MRRVQMKLGRTFFMDGEEFLIEGYSSHALLCRADDGETVIVDVPYWAPDEREEEEG